MFNVFDLGATIHLNQTQFNTGLAGAKAKLQAFGSDVIGKFGAKGLIAGGVAGGLALLGKKALDFTAASVKTGMEFDKSMAQVAATMGKTTAQMEKEVVNVDTSMGKFNGSLRDFAQEMGAKTAFTATEAAEGLNYMALAGYDAETSVKMLPNVLNLAAAGNMELGYASDMVTDAQSALGLSTEETTQLVDKMAKTSSLTNTNVTQLGEAMLRIGGQAKSMRGGTTELTAALGLLASAGTKGAEGGTALRNILLNIQGKKFEQVFSEMGVSAYDSEGKMRSLKDTFGDMSKAMEGMTQQQKDKILSTVFDRRTLKDANTLLNTNAETWDKLTGKINDSKGAAQEMAGTQLDNLQGDVTLFNSALDGVKIKISDAVTPALRGIVQVGTEAMSGLAQAFNSGSLMAGITTMVTSIGVKIAQVAPLIIPAGLTLVQKLGTGILNALPNIVSGAAKIVQTLATSIVANMPKIAAAGLKLVLKLAVALVKNIPKIIAAGFRLVLAIPKGLLKGIPKMISTGGSLIKKFWSGAKSVLSNLPQKAYDWVTKIPSKIKEAVSDFLDAGLNLIQGLWDGIKQKFADVSAWVAEHSKGLGATTRRALGEHSPSKLFKEIGYNVSAGMALGIQDGWDKVGSAMDEMNEGISTYEFDGMDDIGASYTGGTFDETVSIAFGNALNGMIEGMSETMADAMKTAMGDVNITLDKRQFGKMTRKAVAHAL